MIRELLTYNQVQNELRQVLEVAYISKIFALRLPAHPPFPPNNVVR